jgi:hypothetical protein
MRKLFYLIVCLAAAATFAAAQSNLALIRGSVLDPQSHVIPNAHTGSSVPHPGALLLARGWEATNARHPCSGNVLRTRSP